MRAVSNRRAAAAAEAEQAVGGDRPSPASRPAQRTDGDAAFLIIIKQLLSELAEKDAEVERLRRSLKTMEGRLTYLQVRAIDLIVGWEGGL